MRFGRGYFVCDDRAETRGGEGLWATRLAEEFLLDLRVVGGEKGCHAVRSFGGGAFFAGVRKWANRDRGWVEMEYLDGR